MQSFLLWELPPNAQEIARQIFFWSGFSIWVGLTARFLVPTKVANGAWLTLCAGFIGSSLGPIATNAFFDVENFNPVGPAGFVSATLVASATLLLFCALSFLATPNDSDNEEEEDGGGKTKRIGSRDDYRGDRDYYSGEREVRYFENREPRRRFRR